MKKYTYVKNVSLQIHGFSAILVLYTHIQYGIVVVIKKIEQQTCLNSMYIFKEIVSVSVFKRNSVKAMPQLEIIRIKNFV